jgi:hypothetical protein
MKKQEDSPGYLTKEEVMREIKEALQEEEKNIAHS